MKLGICVEWEMRKENIMTVMRDIQKDNHMIIGFEGTWFLQKQESDHPK